MCDLISEYHWCVYLQKYFASFQPCQKYIQVFGLLALATLDPESQF